MPPSDTDLLMAMAFALGVEYPVGAPSTILQGFFVGVKLALRDPAAATRVVAAAERTEAALTGFTPDEIGARYARHAAELAGALRRAVDGETPTEGTAVT